MFLAPVEGTRDSVLGVVLDQASPPHELVLLAPARDARGVPEVEVLGWRE